MPTELYKNTCGQGPRLTLLHGWALHSGVWQTLLPYLIEHYEVTTIDIPGFGQSPMITPYTLEHLSHSIATAIPDGSYCLGWSLGGLIGKKIALDYPQKIKKLITIASNPCFQQKADWPYAVRQDVLQNFADQLQIDFKKTLQRFIAIQTLGSQDQKEELKSLQHQLFQHGAPHHDALEEGLNLLQTVDLRQQLKTIQCPSLHLYGALDALVPRKLAEAVKLLMPQSRYHIIQLASHAPFLSQPRQCFDYIHEFCCHG